MRNNMVATSDIHPEVPRNVNPRPSPITHSRGISAHRDEQPQTGRKSRNLNRLKRIEGQVRGLQRMLEEDRYCPDIIAQVASVQEALRGVARELVRTHLHERAEEAAPGDPEERAAALDEVLDAVYKHLR